MACPDRATLSAWLQDATRNPKGEIALHIQNCAHCQVLLDELCDMGLDEYRAALASGSQSPTNTMEWQDIRSRLVHCDQGTNPLGSDGTVSASVTGLEEVLGAETVPNRFGEYRVEKRIAAGAFGEVLLGWDEKLRRSVAIKLLRADRLNAQSRERFLREAQAVAALDEPTITRIYAVGQLEDRPYFVMEYLDGGTLQDHLDNESLRIESLNESVHYVCDVARGLAAAHEVGLIHRDVKPANVLLDRKSGRAKLTDFGIVRADNLDAATLTQASDLMGTPAYMSPEQVRDAASVDARSDVYSLGVTLYQCLTGEIPFRGTPTMVLNQIQQDEPISPGRLNGSISRDLECICLKAMAKEPIHRYQTAAAFADDLDRFLQDRPVQAKPLSFPIRLWRWCRRNRIVASLLFLLGASLLVGSITSFSMWMRSERNAKRLQTSNQELSGALQDFYHRALKDQSFHYLSEQFRNELTTDLNRYYESLLEASNGDLETRRNIAGRLEELAEVYVQWGYDFSANQLLTQNLAIADGMAADPDLAESDYLLIARVLCQYWDASYKLGIDPGNRDVSRRAIDFAKRAHEATNSLEARVVLFQAKMLDAYDRLRQSEDRSRELENLYDKILQLSKEHPEEDSLLQLLETGDKWLARFAPPREAIRFRRRRGEVFERRIDLAQKKDDPTAVLIRSQLVNQVFLAAKQQQAGDVEQASEGFLSAVTGFRDQLAQSPGIMQTRLDLAETLLKLGNLRWDQGNTNQAVEHFQEVVQLFNGVIAQDPNASQSMIRSSQISEQIAHKLIELNKSEEAAQHYVAAVDSFRKLFALPAVYRAPGYAAEMNRLLKQAARLMREIGDTDQANAYLEEAEQFVSES